MAVLAFIRETQDHDLHRHLGNRRMSTENEKDDSRAGKFLDVQLSDLQPLIGVSTRMQQSSFNILVS